MGSLKIRLGILSIAICVIACNSPSSAVKANGEVEVYVNFPKSEPGNKRIALMQAGDSAQVLATRYSKEFMFYKIRLPDGREGYVMAGDDFTVVESPR
jgi:glutamate racemase